MMANGPFIFSMTKQVFGTRRKGLSGQCGSRPQVEVWLNRVLDRMRATLRHEIPEAVVTYEEKPREQWIFDYPAQVLGGGGRQGGAWGGAGSAPRSVPRRPASAPAGTAVSGGDAHGAGGARWAPVCLQIALTCTQIWWTTEVGLAFSRLEEGYENSIKDYNKKQVRVRQKPCPFCRSVKSGQISATPCGSAQR